MPKPLPPDGDRPATPKSTTSRRPAPRKRSLLWPSVAAALGVGLLLACGFGMFAHRQAAVAQRSAAALQAERDAVQAREAEARTELATAKASLAQSEEARNEAERDLRRELALKKRAASGDDAAREAQRLADENKMLLRPSAVLASVDRAAQAEAAGDPHGAFLWAALASDQAGEASDREVSRQRAAAYLRYPGDHYEPERFFDHPGAIRAAWTAEGQVITAGNVSLQVWPVGGGAPRKLDLLKLIRDVVFSADGRRALVRTDEGWQCWDIATGQALPAPTETLETPTAIAISGDGKRVAASNNFRDVAVWDADTGKQIARKTGLVTAPRWLAFGPTGQRLALADASGRALVWEVGTDKLTPDLVTVGTVAALGEHGFPIPAADAAKRSARDEWKLPAPVGVVTAGSLAPYGVLLAVSDHGVAQASGSDGRWRRLPHPGNVRAVAVRADGVAVTAGAGNVGLWRSDGTPASPVLAHPWPVRHVAHSADGQRLVTVGENAPITLWKRNGGPSMSRTAATGLAAIGPGGQHIVSAQGKEIQVWDLAAKVPNKAIFHDAVPPKALAIGRGGNYLAAITPDGTAGVWQVNGTGERLYRIPRVRHVAFSPDDLWLATVNDAGEITLSLPLIGEVIRTCPRKPGPNAQLVFRDGLRLLALGDDGKIFEWDVTGDKTETWAGEYDPAAGFTVSVDGRRIAAVAGGEPRCWLTATKAAEPPLPWHAAARRVLLGTGHRTLAIGERGVHVWERPAVGSLVERWIPDAVAAAFGPEGRFVATLDAAGIARLWDLETGRPVSPALRSDPPAQLVAPGADGKSVLTIGRDGSPRVWNFNPESLLDESRRRAEALAGFTVADDGTVHPFTPEERRKRFLALAPLHAP